MDDFTRELKRLSIGAASGKPQADTLVFEQQLLEPLSAADAAGLFAAMLDIAIADGAESLTFRLTDGGLEMRIQGQTYDMVAPPVDAVVDLLRWIARASGVTLGRDGELSVSTERGKLALKVSHGCSDRRSSIVVDGF